MTPPMKTFVIKKIGDVAEKTISFKEEDCKKVFEKACKMYKVSTEKYVLHYPLRQSDGKSRRMTISLDEFVHEQCTSFYRTCEEYSQLILEEVHQLILEDVHQLILEEVHQLILEEVHQLIPVFTV